MELRQMKANLPGAWNLGVRQEDMPVHGAQADES